MLLSGFCFWFQRIRTTYTEEEKTIETRKRVRTHLQWLGRAATTCGKIELWFHLNNSLLKWMAINFQVFRTKTNRRHDEILVTETHFFCVFLFLFLLLWINLLVIFLLCHIFNFVIGGKKMLKRKIYSYILRNEKPFSIDKPFSSSNIFRLTNKTDRTKSICLLANF